MTPRNAFLCVFVRGASLATLVATVVGCGGAAEVVRPLTGRAEFDRVFAEYDRPGSPGCALGVIQNGEFLYARGYGEANLEHAVPITPATVFRIASVSKQFTAMVVLLLEERGDLSLDDRLGRWLPELEHLGSITVRHLVHHTSGLRDYLVLTWLAGYRETDYYDADQLMGLLSRQQALNFAPGEEFLYSNTGYFLLGVIAARAGGESFESLAEELIFAPLGMRDTRFYSDTTEVVRQRAYGYSGADDGFAISMTPLPIVGDGGVFTSVNDLLAWDRNFYDNTLGQGDPELIRRWITPGRLNDGEPAAGNGGWLYAAGIGLDEYRGLRRVSHGGGFVGFRAQMARYPDVRTTIITLCNVAQSNPTGLGERVADALLADTLGLAPAPTTEASEEGVPDEFSVSMSQLRQYQGRYVSRELGTTYTIEIRDGQLVVQPEGRDALLLQAVDGETFVDTTNGVRLRFARDRAGRVDGFDVEAGRVTNLWFERIG